MSQNQSSPLSRSARVRNLGIEIDRTCVLDADPELRNGLDPAALPAQRRASCALTCSLPAGRFVGAPGMFDLEGGLGLLIVDGLIIRQILAGDVEILELIGPGDVVRPTVEMDRGAAPCDPGEWTVLRRARVAIMDRSFALAVSAWPEIAANIGDRVAMRVSWMAFSTAIRGIRRVDRRLLAMLWSYADRWGRVTPDGVVLELELTHQQLAGLVGARRPSVTTALSMLERNGELHRRRDHGWVLASRPAAHVQEPTKPRKRYEQEAQRDHQGHDLRGARGHEEGR